MASQLPIGRLSPESANKHYLKLEGIHHSDYLSLAQKVSIFQHDLEHNILKEITGKQDFYNQLNWLKDNQIRMINGNKQGFIEPTLVSDIENLKKWRNKGVHQDDMPKAKYDSHFYTMAETIKFFSSIPWSEEINSIINNKTQDNKILKITEVERKTANNKSEEGDVRMELINTNEQLRNNIKTFDDYLINGSPDVKEWTKKELLECTYFVAYLESEELRFAPCIFVGYIDNTFENQKLFLKKLMLIKKYLMN